jgi:endoglucanase
VGFNHVRINLHPFRDSQADGSLSTDYWTTLDWVIQQSLTNKLAVILDFHEFLEMGKNPSTKKGRFLGIWRYIAERYKDVPSEVYFEILNEPNEKLTPALWNQYFREALTIVRKTNPKRTIIVGPGQWNSIDALEKLDLPKEDHNLIVTVHFYNPFDFTHQGAPWTDYKDKTGILWSGTEQEREAIIQDLDRAQTWSKKHSRPIYLGEFGVYDQAEISSRVRYLNFVARQAEKMGWSWAYWQFDSNFLLYDIPKRQWVKPVLESLIPSGPLKASNKMNNLYAR